MPVLPCKICSKGFYAKPNWIKLGHGKYCSRKCQFIAQKKGREVNCDICGTKTYKQPKALRISKSKKYFCSKSCQTVWRNSVVFVGERHSNWKGGASTYRAVMARNKIPAICKRCGNDDKRILAVHHLDRNRGNNILKNLIWLCPNCHTLIHRDILERQKLMVALV